LESATSTSYSGSGESQISWLRKQSPVGFIGISSEQYTYSFYKVKRTLKQFHGYIVKPCRYWNETCCASVQDHILYSLAEYCPGLPKAANTVADNQYMGIHPYHMLETYSKYDGTGKRANPDVEATIAALVAYGTIPNREQTVLEDLMEKVQEVTNKYFQWAKSWPFLAAHRLLTMQLQRCNHIKKVLTELLNNHPLNSAAGAIRAHTLITRVSNSRCIC
jgi:hypothetical protein